MNNFLELYEKFLKALETDDEDKIKDFLVENFDKFPEDVQIEIVGTFFEEAVDRTYNFIKKEEELVGIKNDIERLKRILEDKKRELEIKKELEGQN
jgi:pheromone shutdown protein TraB